MEKYKITFKKSVSKDLKFVPKSDRETFEAQLFHSSTHGEVETFDNQKRTQYLSKLEFKSWLLGVMRFYSTKHKVKLQKHVLATGDTLGASISAIKAEKK